MNVKTEQPKSSETVSTQLSEAPVVALTRATDDVWHLQFHFPDGQKALWLRFSHFISQNGFKKHAEVLGVFFQKDRSGEKKDAKVVVKQVFPLEEFQRLSQDTTLRIGESTLSPSRTVGRIESQGKSLAWDLELTRVFEGPKVGAEVLSRVSWVADTGASLTGQVLVTGQIKVNGETFHCSNAHGLDGYRPGPKNGRSWSWGHCNSFVDEAGKASDFVFEGLSAKLRVGPFITPRLTSLFFLYQGKRHTFSSMRGIFQIKSRLSLNEWQFEAGKEDLSFRGRLRSEHKDFVGLAHENTDGSLLFYSASRVADLEIIVYRKGKLETTLQAKGAAAFDLVSPQKNPYVTFAL